MPKSGPRKFIDLNFNDDGKPMRRGDWVLVLVFVLLHLAAAIIRGVPVGIVLFGALLMLVTILAISKGNKKWFGNFEHLS